MAFTEYLEFAPRSPGGYAVLSDRYLAVIGAEMNVAMFDAVTHTARAFTAFGDLQPIQVFFYDGYLWVVAGRAVPGNPNRIVITQINLSTGDGTRYDPPMGMYYVYTNPTAFVVDDLAWLTQRTLGAYVNKAGYYDMGDPTTFVTVAFSEGPVLVGGVVYIRGTKDRRNASTGAALADAGANFPNGYGFADGTVYWYQDSSSLKSWDTSTETEYRPPIASALVGAPTLGPDGLVYSANSTELRIVDRVSGAIRIETFDTARNERTRVAVVDGMLYTISGYPI